MKLSEMLDETDPRLSRFINDYEMSLLDPHIIDDFSGFHTELGEVLEFIKRQNEDDYLKAMKAEKGENWELRLDSVNMINTFTGANIPIDDAKGGKLNMCRATEAIREDGINVGRIEGRVEGKEEGITEGWEKGMERINALNNLLILNDRIEDLKRGAVDRKYQKKLLMEFFPDEAGTATA